MGGNWVGLPGWESKIDFREPATGDADLLLLCKGWDPLGNRARSFSVSLLYGRGLCIIEPDDFSPVAYEVSGFSAVASESMSGV